MAVCFDRGLRVRYRVRSSQYVSAGSQSVRLSPAQPAMSRSNVIAPAGGPHVVQPSGYGRASQQDRGARRGSSVRESAHPVPARSVGARTSRVATSRQSAPAAGPPPGHSRRDDDEDGRDNDADDPPDPVDAAGCLDAQSSGDVVTDQYAADAAEQG